MLKAPSLILEQQKIRIICSVLKHMLVCISVEWLATKHLIMIALIICSEKKIFI